MEIDKCCVIFGAGQYDGFKPSIPEGSVIIAADAGLKKCESLGIMPDIILGDFDSLGSKPNGNSVVVLPVEKDVTDTSAAVSKGMELGCRTFYIYGGMGGRPDHSMANYALCACLSQSGIRCHLFGDGYEVTAVTDSVVSLHGETGKTVSVFSFTDTSDGVTYTGLKYPLVNARLSSAFPLGVSNSFTSDNATVEVKKGTLIIMTER